MPQKSPGFAYASPQELTKSFSQYGYAPMNPTHHNHRRHRSGREYDSDTGYRSETEVTRYRRQQMLAQYGGYEVERDMNPFKRRGKDGYSSDLEGYSQRTQNSGYRLQQQPLQSQSKSNSLPYNLNSNPQNVILNSQLDNVNRGSQIENVNRTPTLENVNLASQFDNVNRTPQLDNVNRTPQTDSVINTPQTESVGRIPQPPNSRRVVVRNEDLFAQQMKLQQNNSNKMGGNKNLTDLIYQPPSPSQFHHSKIMDQSTPVSSDPPSGFTFNTSRSRSNSASGSNEDNENKHPDWRKDFYNDQMQIQGPQSMAQKASSPSDRPPPYKAAPPYLQGVAGRKLPSTPNRSSPYGVYNYDKRTTNSPIMYQRINEVPNSDNCDNKVDLRSQGYHSNQYQSNFRQNDYSYQDNVYSASYNNENLRTPEMSKRSTTPLSNSKPERSRTPGSVSGDERRNSRDSPRESGYGSREQSSHRNSPNDSNHSHKQFYDSYNTGSYFEPGESRNPTMSAYDEVEMYKSDDPLSQISQVSSSTDSGYHQATAFDQADSPSKYSGYGMPPPSRAPPDPSSFTTYSTPNTKDFPSREPTPDHSSTSSSSVPVYTQSAKRFDKGIFITKVAPDGPAAMSLRAGDKVLEVNGQDFNNVHHDEAVNVMKNSKTVSLYVEREFL